MEALRCPWRTAGEEEGAGGMKETVNAEDAIREEPSCDQSTRAAGNTRRQPAPSKRPKAAPTDCHGKEWKPTEAQSDLNESFSIE